MLIAPLLLAATMVTPTAQAKAAADAKPAAKPYTAPKTPWGDPDISGPVTNVFEASTPFERPAEFAGRALADVTPEELLKYRSTLAERTLKNFEGPLHGPDNWWQTIYDLRKG